MLSTVEKVTVYRRYFSELIINQAEHDGLPWFKKLLYKEVIQIERVRKLAATNQSIRRTWANDSTSQSSGGISHVTHVPADTIPYVGLYNPLDPFMPGFMPGLSVPSSPAPEPDRPKDPESTSGGDFGGGGAGSSYDDSPSHSSHSHHTDTSPSHHDSSHSYDSSSSDSDSSSSWGDSSSSSDSTSYDSGSSYDSSSSDSGSSWND